MFPLILQKCFHTFENLRIYILSILGHYMEKLKPQYFSISLKNEILKNAIVISMKERSKFVKLTKDST